MNKGREKKCRNCRFSYIGDYNQPIAVAHEYPTDKFDFIKSEEDIIAIPVSELECEHERNWRPSKGNLQVDMDYSCKYFEPRND